MRDYLVRIARHGDILIRADSAEEAARTAQRFGSTSWDNFRICVEVVGNEVNQDDKSENVKEIRNKDIKKGKSLKEVIASRNPKMRQYVNLDEYDIPF